MGPGPLARGTFAEEMAFGEMTGKLPHLYGFEELEPGEKGQHQEITFIFLPKKMASPQIGRSH